MSTEGVFPARAMAILEGSLMIAHAILTTGKLMVVESLFDEFPSQRLGSE